MTLDGCDCTGEWVDGEELHTEECATQRPASEGCAHRSWDVTSEYPDLAGWTTSRRCNDCKELLSPLTEMRPHFPEHAGRRVVTVQKTAGREWLRGGGCRHTWKLGPITDALMCSRPGVCVRCWAYTESLSYEIWELFSVWTTADAEKYSEEVERRFFGG